MACTAVVIWAQVDVYSKEVGRPDHAPMPLIEVLTILANVANWKQRRDRSFFEEVVQPLYMNAELVYKDYTRIFSEVIGFLDEGQEGVSRSISYLINERRKHMAERTKIREAIHMLRQRSTFSSVNFQIGLEGLLCAGVSQYEPRDHVDLAGFYKKNHTILGFLTEVSQNEVPAHMLPDFCRAQAMKQLEGLDEAFKTLTVGFYEMQGKALG